MSVVEFTSAERFDRDYPANLPARLKWLEEQLQVNRRQMLRFMGLPHDQVSFLTKRSWREITRGRERLAERAEHLLTHYLSYFDYDVKRAKAFPQEFAEEVQQGRYNLADYVPALALAKTPVERVDALLTVILEDESRLLPVLATFLATPHLLLAIIFHTPA
jgi:hypothetical protein